METPFQEDAEHKNNMERGSRWLLEALKNGETDHKDFRWVNRVTGAVWQPGQEPREYRSKGYQRALNSAAEKESALARRVYRDPCPVCNVRGDIGCKHQRVA